jgi:hypothetical protein
MLRSGTVRRDEVHHREGLAMPPLPKGTGHPGRLMTVEQVAVQWFEEVGHWRADNPPPGQASRTPSLPREVLTCPLCSTDDEVHVRGEAARTGRRHRHRTLRTAQDHRGAAGPHRHDRGAGRAACGGSWRGTGGLRPAYARSNKGPRCSSATQRPQ